MSAAGKSEGASRAACGDFSQSIPYWRGGRL